LGGIFRESREFGGGVPEFGVPFRAKGDLMRNRISIFELITVAVIALFCAIQADATTIKGVRTASNYGPESSFAACASGSVGFNCEAFGTASTVSFGGTDFSVSQFVFGDGVAPGTVLNLVDLGVLGANQTFTLPTSLFDPTLTEIFACGTGSDGATFAMDSVGKNLGTFCTAGLTGTLPPVDQNGTSFTTGAGYNFAGDLVLDAPASSVVGTPEPGTMVLLSLGLVALSGKSLRKRLARRSA
jgi:hypothetical protein